MFFAIESEYYAVFIQFKVDFERFLMHTDNKKNRA